MRKVRGYEGARRVRGGCEEGARVCGYVGARVRGGYEDGTRVRGYEGLQVWLLIVLPRKVISPIHIASLFISYCNTIHILYPGFFKVLAEMTEGKEDKELRTKKGTKGGDSVSTGGGVCETRGGGVYLGYIVLFVMRGI